MWLTFNGEMTKARYSDIILAWKISKQAEVFTKIVFPVFQGYVNHLPALSMQSKYATKFL